MARVGPKQGPNTDRPTAHRWAAAAAALLLVGILPGIADPVAASFELLQNGSLEGAATKANGFERFFPGSKLVSSPVDTGTQAVNLARSGAPNQDDETLGRVVAYASGFVPLNTMEGVSWFYNVPLSMPANILFLHFYLLDTNFDGKPNFCLSHTGPLIDQTPGWVQLSFDTTTQYALVDDSCPSQIENEPLSSFQTFQGDPVLGPAAVLGVGVQTRTAISPWVTNRPVYVDTLSAQSGVAPTAPPPPVNAGLSLQILGQAVFRASPGDNLNLQARVTNTGDTTDTVQWHLFASPGWGAVAPTDVTLASGAFADVSIPVVSPGGGQNGFFKLSATSTVDDTINKSVSWIVEVPVLVSLRVANSPTILGEVLVDATAFYLNGDPAVGVSVHVQDSAPFPAQFERAATGRIGSDGTLRLRFGTDPLGATMIGTHDLLGTFRSGGRPFEASASYFCGVI